MSTRPFSWFSGYCFWLLAIPATIILLGALSRSQYFEYGYNLTIPTAFLLPISTRVPSKGPDDPPVLAYLISGSHGDGKKILRLLKAIYHPRNQYLLELDAGSGDRERTELAIWVQSERVFGSFGNVNVVGKSHALNRMGASSLAAVLHAAALLLKISADWDWFITLSASDYPLVSQDDVLHAFSLLPKDANFIHYTSNIGWNERETSNRIIVDPSLYNRKSSPVFYAVETRTTPDAFKIFGVFNTVHFSFRTAIERTFGVWKARWGFLHNMPRYDFGKVQVPLVGASMALHNFIRRNSNDDEVFNRVTNAKNFTFNDMPNVAGVGDNNDGEPKGDDDVHMNDVRKSIQNELVRHQRELGF